MTDEPWVLDVTGLSVVIDGFHILRTVDFRVREGELRFLIGPNGAGKTTLIDTITGLTKPTAGSIRVGGQELRGKREHQIVRLGVGRTFQTPTIFEQLTVAENLDLAAGFRRSLGSLLRRPRGLAPAVDEALHTIGLHAHADRLAVMLSHGQRQWLEIGMLLVQNHRLLLLDEPVAGMTKDERTATGQLLERIVESRTVVVVEHDMAFLRRFARLVTVLNEGEVLCEGTVAAVQANQAVQDVYLGHRAERGRSAAVV